ncbi:hypothetical protein EON66_01560 [archaeon]|nr:MAG: hypothetical protein EON66_01560 [archaeon]
MQPACVTSPVCLPLPDHTSVTPSGQSRRVSNVQQELHFLGTFQAVEVHPRGSVRTNHREMTNPSVTGIRSAHAVVYFVLALIILTGWVAVRAAWSPSRDVQLAVAEIASTSRVGSPLVSEHLTEFAASPQSSGHHSTAMEARSLTTMMQAAGMPLPPSSCEAATEWGSRKRRGITVHAQPHAATKPPIVLPHVVHSQGSGEPVVAQPNEAAVCGRQCVGGSAPNAAAGMTTSVVVNVSIHTPAPSNSFQCASPPVPAAPAPTAQQTADGERTLPLTASPHRSEHAQRCAAHLPRGVDAAPYGQTRASVAMLKQRFDKGQGGCTTQCGGINSVAAVTPAAVVANLAEEEGSVPRVAAVCPLAEPSAIFPDCSLKSAVVRTVDAAEVTAHGDPEPCVETLPLSFARDCIHQPILEQTAPEQGTTLALTHVRHTDAVPERLSMVAPHPVPALAATNDVAVTQPNHASVPQRCASPAAAVLNNAPQTECSSTVTLPERGEERFAIANPMLQRGKTMGLRAPADAFRRDSDGEGAWWRHESMIQWHELHGLTPLAHTSSGTSSRVHRMRKATAQRIHAQQLKTAQKCSRRDSSADATATARTCAPALPPRPALSASQSALLALLQGERTAPLQMNCAVEGGVDQGAGGGCAAAPSVNVSDTASAKIKQAQANM